MPTVPANIYRVIYAFTSKNCERDELKTTYIIAYNAQDAVNRLRKRWKTPRQEIVSIFNDITDYEENFV